MDFLNFNSTGEMELEEKVEAGCWGCLVCLSCAACAACLLCATCGICAIPLLGQALFGAVAADVGASVTISVAGSSTAASVAIGVSS